MPKITKRLVDALRPERNGKDVFVWDAGDGAIKGFGIRMKPSGAASYFVQYRNKEGRTRRLVIGKVGTLAPEEARKTGRRNWSGLPPRVVTHPPNVMPCAVLLQLPIYASCTWLTPGAALKASTWVPGQKPHRDARQAAYWTSALCGA